jgi:hypothetical protein
MTDKAKNYIEVTQRILLSHIHENQEKIAEMIELLKGGLSVIPDYERMEAASKFLLYPELLSCEELGEIVQVWGNASYWASIPILKNLFHNIPGGFEFHLSDSRSWIENIRYRYEHLLYYQYEYGIDISIDPRPYHRECRTYAAKTNSLGYHFTRDYIRFYYRTYEEKVLASLIDL